MTIISNLPEVVSEQNLSLADLARLTGMTQRSITKLYYADITSIRIETLDRLCDTLGTTPGKLLTFHPGALSKHMALTKIPSSPTRTRPHSRNKRAQKAKIIPDKEEMCATKHTSAELVDSG